MSILNKQKYILGLSGGPDSSALLSFYYPYIKICCIVNYNVRPDSQNDVDKAIALCKRYKLKYEVLTIDKDIYDNTDIDNFQSWARKVRYDFFYETAKKCNAKCLLIGHHLDDFLETGYIQKQKNSKALFYGIKEKSLWKDLTIYRPFVNKYRKETLKRICIDKNIDFAIDSSNESDIYERNRVRKILSTYSDQTLLDLYNWIRKYNKQNRKKYKKNEKVFKKFILNDFDLSIYEILDSEQKYYLVYNYLSLQNIYKISSSKINGIIEFLDSKSNKKYRLEKDIHLYIENNKLCIE